MACLPSWKSQPGVGTVYVKVDQDRSGTIDFKEFLSVIEKQKAEEATQSDETFTIEAFVALGGQVCLQGLHLLHILYFPIDLPSTSELLLFC